ncbi:VPLPA-CTERM sorting domain-containing protein [Tropicibacter sp. S64]|uniref:VPLPA-CTERM sorting domain-containing protein n=1 Tax=Tropicibacter sp. S64 TaxID=3415122 RepID=UPI003C7C17E3
MSHFVPILSTALAFGLATPALAVTVNGADLGTAPGFGLPNGAGAVTGTSMAFGTGPFEDVVLVTLDLGGATSGTIAMDLTRTTSDMDVTFGLSYGTVFDWVGLADQGLLLSSPGLGTFDGTGYGWGSLTTSNVTPVFPTGPIGTITYAFDLVAGTYDLTYGTYTLNGTFKPGFDTGQPMTFLLGKNNASEAMQVDSISYSLGSAEVPLPAGLPLLAGALAGLAVLRRRAV